MLKEQDSADDKAENVTHVSGRKKDCWAFCEGILRGSNPTGLRQEQRGPAGAWQMMNTPFRTLRPAPGMRLVYRCKGPRTKPHPFLTVLPQCAAQRIRTMLGSFALTCIGATCQVARSQ